MLITRPPEMRESVLNFPFLLQLSAPKTVAGKVLCVSMLLSLQIVLLRYSALWVLFLYDFTHNFSGWG